MFRVNLRPKRISAASSMGHSKRSSRPSLGRSSNALLAGHMGRCDAVVVVSDSVGLGSPTDC